MAVTKTHPIKSTLKAAIDYICDPDKTDGRLLVSSFGCAAKTADIEFAWTRRHAIDKGTHLGRHLIQAFEPGEVTPAEAHRIGMELAREVLGGKYDGDNCGIRTQELWIDQYISKHGLVSVGESKVFESGTTMNRPSLQELIQKAEEQAYDILAVSALDRLGRDLWSAMEYTKKLLRMGIRIISVNDNTEITERDFEEMDNFIKSFANDPLWKCGKRPLHRWKANIHGPMEKLSAFPQPANTVSHSSAPLTVYTHSHSAYYCCRK